MNKNLLYFCLILAQTLLGQNGTVDFTKIETKRIVSTNNMEWIQFGPGMSGYCEFFWAHPTDPNTYHIAPDMFNGYGSFDNARSWKVIKDFDGRGFDMGRTYDIEFSRQNANFGFATDELGGLFKTNNKGRSWQKTNFDLGGAHNEIAVDPNNDNVWFIGAGTFWDVKRFHRTATDATGGSFRPKAVLGHIYKSTDKGVTWKKIKTGLPNKLAVGKIIVSPRNSNRIIMVANTGLYISTDTGESWTKSTNNGLPNNLPRDLTSHYNEVNDSFTLFLVDQTSYTANGNSYTSKGGVFKSTNGGNTWTSITGDLGLDLTKITSNSTNYYYKRSIAKWLGVNQNDVKSGRPTKIFQNYNRINVNPRNPLEIYITHNVKHDFSFGPGDVWKTDNGGLNWYPTLRTGAYWLANKDRAYWNSRAVKVSGVNTKFAHLQHDMDIREEIWGCRFIAVNPNGDMFASIDQQILRSNDDGKTWNQIDHEETSPGSKSWASRGNSNLPGRYIYLETGVPNRKFFLSGEHGLWKSTSLGNINETTKVASTQIEGQVNEGGALSTATLAVHPTNPNIIYTLQFRQNHRNYIRRSTDGGSTWSNFGKVYDRPDTNLSSEHIYSSSLMIDPKDANNIYFTAMRYSPSEINEGRSHSFNDFGIYKSSDAGKNWSRKNSGLPANGSIRRIAMHPNNSNTLYAASNLHNGVMGGLYRSTNRAENWTKVTIPNVIKSVNNVHINKETNDIFISCGTKSGPTNAGGVWKSTDNGSSWTKIFNVNNVWQTETSPLNSDIIIISAPKSTVHINPGAYISRDGGKSWIKANKNLAHSNAITDIKPDTKDENIFWCSGWGSGWYKGVLNPGLASNNPEGPSTPSTPSAKKTFFIVNRQTGDKLRSSEKDNNGKQLEMVPGTWNGDATKWTKIDTDNGYYYLKNVETGLFFRPEADGEVINSALIQRPNTFTGNYTQWKSVNTTNGHFHISNRLTKMYFRPETEDDFSKILQKPNTAIGNWTQWTFVDASNATTFGPNKVLKVSKFDSEASKKIRLYPNPAKNSEVVHVDLAEENTKGDITVYDIQGKSVYNLANAKNLNKLDLKQLMSGMYIVVLKTPKTKIVKKLILK